MFTKPQKTIYSLGHFYFTPSFMLAAAHPWQEKAAEKEFASTRACLTEASTMRVSEQGGENGRVALESCSQSVGRRRGKKGGPRRAEEPQDTLSSALSA